MTRRHVVLLDLDGTLIDSAPGIVAGVRQAFGAVDVPVPADEVMRSWIGPPVRETLQRELGSYGRATVDRANAAFREYFDTVGAHQSVVFAGIPDALAHLAASGSHMRLVTHKPLPLAEVAVSQHALGAFLDGIHAPPSPQVTVAKEDLFADAMGAAGPCTVISVGDRGSDIRAAAAHGIAGIGVMWGYGSAAELQGAGALEIAATPADLPDLVRPPGER